MAKSFVNTCIGDHRSEFRGPFAFVRNRLWWLRHNKCEEARRG